MTTLNVDAFEKVVEEATVSSLIATGLFFLHGPDLVPYKLFVTNAIGCGIYNEFIRKDHRPKDWLDTIARGAGYGLFAEIGGRYYEVSTAKGVWAAGFAASAVGNFYRPVTEQFLHKLFA